MCSIVADHKDTQSWSKLAAGGATAASLAGLCAVDVAELSGADLVDAIVCAEKGMSLLAARQAELMAELAVPFRAGDPRRLAGRLARTCRLQTPVDLNGPDDQELSPFLPDAAICLAGAEVAAALRIAPVTGSVRVRDAVELGTDLQLTRHALAAGAIDRGKCRIIMAATDVLTADQKIWVQNAVLPLAGERSTAQLRDAVARAVMVIDPDGTRRRHEDAVARRDLRLEAANDGMAILRGRLRADHAAGIFQLTDLLAHHTQHPQDTRSIGARRIDALSDIADQLLTHGHIDLGHWTPPRRNTQNGPGTTPTGGDTAGCDTAPAGHTPGGSGGLDARRATDPAFPDVPATAVPAPRASRRLSRQGRRPHLTVTIADTTLAELDDLPGTLAGHGPIPADLARTIARSAATITALLVDPATGAAITAGTREYRPHQALRDHATTLANTCRFPSCRQPSWRCDLDHRTSFNHAHPQTGGATEPDNLDPTCRRHHQLKHTTTWTSHRTPGDLTTTWTSPTGHTYLDPPREAACPTLWGATPAPEPPDRSGPRPFLRGNPDHHQVLTDLPLPDEPPF